MLFVCRWRRIAWIVLVNLDQLSEIETPILTIVASPPRVTSIADERPVIGKGCAVTLCQTDIRVCSLMKTRAWRACVLPILLPLVCIGLHQPATAQTSGTPIPLGIAPFTTEQVVANLVGRNLERAQVVRLVGDDRELYDDAVVRLVNPLDPGEARLGAGFARGRQPIRWRRRGRRRSRW